MAKALFSDVIKFLETHSETQRVKLDYYQSKDSVSKQNVTCFEFQKFQFTANINVSYHSGFYEKDLGEFSYDLDEVNCDILETYDTIEEEYLKFSKSEIADLELELSTSLNIELYKF